MKKLFSSCFSVETCSWTLQRLVSCDCRAVMIKSTLHANRLRRHTQEWDLCNWTVCKVKTENFLPYLERMVSNQGGKPQESRCFTRQLWWQKDLTEENMWETSSCSSVKRCKEHRAYNVGSLRPEWGLVRLSYLEGWLRDSNFSI